MANELVGQQYFVCGDDNTAGNNIAGNVIVSKGALAYAISANDIAGATWLANYETLLDNFLLSGDIILSVGMQDWNNYATHGNDAAAFETLLQGIVDTLALAVLPRTLYFIAPALVSNESLDNGGGTMPQYRQAVIDVATANSIVYLDASTITTTLTDTVHIDEPSQYRVMNAMVDLIIQDVTGSAPMADRRVITYGSGPNVMGVLGDHTAFYGGNDTVNDLPITSWPELFAQQNPDWTVHVDGKDNSGGVFNRLPDAADTIGQFLDRFPDIQMLITAVDTVDILEGATGLEALTTVSPWTSLNTTHDISIINLTTWPASADPRYTGFTELDTYSFVIFLGVDLVAGVNFLDIGQILEDGGTIQVLAAIYDSGDGIHHNTAGSQAIADAFPTALAALKGENWPRLRNTNQEPLALQNTSGLVTSLLK